MEIFRVLFFQRRNFVFRFLNSLMTPFDFSIKIEQFFILFEFNHILLFVNQDIQGVHFETDVANYLYGLADVIKVVRIDFVTPKVTVISLPRDLWVQIPGIEDFGVTEGKLNQSYFYWLLSSSPD